MDYVEDVKICRRCGIEKPLLDFYERKDNRPGRRSECKTCWKVQTDAYRAKNQQRVAYLHKMKNIERKYAITRHEYEACIKMQDNRCPVCAVEFIGTRGVSSPAVDHCHTTSKVRGVICNGCNVAIGSAKDDPSILRALAAYLEVPSA